MDNSRHEKELVFAQILYLYIIPILLLYYGVVPGHFRVLMLFAITLLLYGIIKRANWSYRDLGIKKNFLKDFIPYTVFTIIGVVVLFLVAKATYLVGNRSDYKWWEDARFLLLFVPISVLQEIVFRGILMKFLRHAFKSPSFIILLNASLFALIHVIYVNSMLVLPITFVGGIGFAYLYYKYPNLILISISHTILNFVAMILGFFVIR